MSEHKTAVTFMVLLFAVGGAGEGKGESEREERSRVSLLIPTYIST